MQKNYQNSCDYYAKKYKYSNIRCWKKAESEEMYVLNVFFLTIIVSREEMKNAVYFYLIFTLALSTKEVSSRISIISWVPDNNVMFQKWPKMFDCFSWHGIIFIFLQLGVWRKKSWIVEPVEKGESRLKLDTGLEERTLWGVNLIFFCTLNCQPEQKSRIFCSLLAIEIIGLASR